MARADKFTGKHNCEDVFVGFDGGRVGRATTALSTKVKLVAVAILSANDKRG